MREIVDDNSQGRHILVTSHCTRNQMKKVVFYIFYNYDPSQSSPRYLSYITLFCLLILKDSLLNLQKERNSKKKGFYHPMRTCFMVIATYSIISIIKRKNKKFIKVKRMI